MTWGFEGGRPLPLLINLFPDEPITLRQLATHTSGITDQWLVYEATYHYGGDSPIPLDEFLDNDFTPNGKHYGPRLIKYRLLDNMLGASGDGPAIAPHLYHRLASGRMPVEEQELRIYRGMLGFHQFDLESIEWQH